MIIQCRSAVRLFGAAVVSAVLSVFGSPPAPAAEPVTVFAAASLTNVFETIGAGHETKTGQAVRFSFASSSTLAKQIEAGAPAQIFASANEQWMDHLDKLGLLEKGTRVSVIGNTLVLIAPVASSLKTVTIDQDTDFAALLKPGERLALGDPDHVPVGIYAREAMQQLGLWAAMENRQARTNDVPAALVLVETGEVPLGIVYATDAAVSAKVRIVGTFPAGSHAPITYPLAIIAGQDRPEVRAVYDALIGPEARKVYEAAGFTIR